jgi:hypothetical protein
MKLLRRSGGRSVPDCKKNEKKEQKNEKHHKYDIKNASFLSLNRTVADPKRTKK